MNPFVLPGSRSSYQPVLSRRQQLLASVCSALPVVIMMAASFSWLAWTARGSRHKLPRDAAHPSSSPRTVEILARTDSRPGHDDVRVVRSPVFFSLPSPLGFSAPLLEDPAMTPAPALDAGLPLFMVSTPALEPAGFGETSRSLAELISQERTRPLPRMLDIFSIHQIPAEAAQSPYATFWLDRPGDPAPVVAGPPIADENPGAVPWEAIYFLCLDEQGFVTRLLAEKPPPIALVNESWLRRLRAAFFPDAPARQCHRLVIRYTPTSAPAERTAL